MMRGSYEKLKIWQKALSFVRQIYISTQKFPTDERFGLISQMRRSAVSIPSNIAEGSQRTSNKEFAHFILMAKGSLAELSTQIHIAHTLKYIPAQQMKELHSYAEEINKMLFSFHKSLMTED